MFIPRSLAPKRVPKSNTPAHKSDSTPSPSVSADSLPGPSNPKKRAVEDEANGESSDDKTTDSDDSSDEETSSDSNSDEDEEHEGSKNPADSTLTGSKEVKSTNGTARQQQTQSDLAARLELALSDLSLWRNENLFRRIAESQDWYIPFSRLHDHPFLSPYLSESSTRIPDAALINALRTYGSGAFESRMKIRAPSNAAWKGKAQSAWVGAAGGYEVRCKSWDEREEGWMDDLASTEEGAWEEKTVYVERVPTAVRSVWTLYHFITALARACQSSDQPLESQIVQDVFVPTAEPTIATRPPETMQRFRGQAFVVFSTTALARAFTSRWGWESKGGAGSASSSAGNEKWKTEDAVAAATFSGFRSITKTRWDELKQEYLAHQARILKQNPRAERRPVPSVSNNDKQTPYLPTSAPTAAPPVLRQTRPARPPPFPPGILVFVRRLHPETNKTTLKTLFGRAFPKESGDAIEYLDFQKGIDSAHIRLRTPDDASTLVAHFTSHPLSQQDGLDSEGHAANKGGAIEMEVVSGVRETNYWEKVPEKIRMAAVSRAGLGGDSGGVGGEERGRRKRQRKG
ncbi:RNA binding motif domain-containing protein [Ceratobasidium sp. AG-Ba]|nr:RNA binding motif domain-containing protein [Ceratobasidium sp. AG-Ba]